MPNPNLLCPNQIGAQALPDLEFAERPATTILHVAPSGDDSNPGTLERPWKTIKKAAASLTNDQAAYVHPGEYREERIMTGHPGLADAPISLIGASRAVVSIVGDPAHIGDREAPFLIVSQPYWIIEGFEIDARGQRGDAVRVQDTHHVLLRDIHAHDGTGRAAIVFSQSQDAALLDSEVHSYKNGGEDSHGVLVQPGSRRLLVRNNHSSGNDGDAIQCVGVDRGAAPQDDNADDPSDITIEGNRYHDNRENAVDLKSCARVTVRGNQCFGSSPASTSAQGAALVAHYFARSVLIEHNRIWNSGAAATIGAATAGGRAGSVVVRRNVIFNLQPAPSRMRCRVNDRVKVLRWVPLLIVLS